MTELPTIIARLAADGLDAPGDCLGRLNKHMALIREWNRAVSLVSKGDLAELESRHVVDSLSLAPVLAHLGVSEGLLLDVGSGGGFPAIPLAATLPRLRVVLLERSERKIGFLRKLRGALGLERVEVRYGSFPDDAQALQPDVVTARAVENAEAIVGEMGPLVEQGAVFLCQAGDPRELAPEMFHVEPSAKRFHVEHWADDWTKDGLRRGHLYLVSPATTP